jgi:HPt (histidine-containing phosphotransfer) domain-containing protein
LAEVLQRSPEGAPASAAAAGPREEEIDWPVFDRLLASKTAARHLPQLLEMVETDSGGRLEALHQQVSAGQWAAARAEAHTLKGSVGYLGLVRLARLCREMEVKAEEKDSTAFQQLIADFHRGLAPSISALRSRT